MKSLSTQLRHVVWVALLAALYFALAKLSLLTAIPPGYATSVWPPSGLALAAVVLLGRRVWPGIWIGAALANLTVQSSIPAAAIIATGNSLEALVAAALMRRYIAAPVFQQGEDVFRFLAVAAAAAMVAATIGTLAISAVGPASSTGLATIWSTWWQGDLTGMIVVAPLILCWAPGRGVAWTRRRVLELSLLLIGLAVVGHVAFGSGLVDTRFAALVLALTLPLVIWVAFRFDQPEVVLTIAVLTAVAVGYTVAGRSLVAGDSVETSLWHLLAFVSILAVSGLAISAVVGERRRAMNALRKSHDELEQRVTERAQDVLRSEETFRLLVEGVQDYAIFMLDVDGRVANWNQGARKIKGYTAEEIVGQHFSRFYPSDAIERKWPDQELALAKLQGRFEDEGWRLRKDGTRFWANVIITALRGPDGRLRGFAKVTRDLTDRKRIEALEGSERRVNEFLAMLAHELRNPLAPIRNALGVMQLAQAGDPSHERSRGVIERQVAQLTRLVDDLLDVGRITSGKVVLKKEPIELNAAFRRAVESCEAAASARKQTIEAQYTTEPLFIDGDTVRLSQIVLNLLNNAIKYTPDHGRIRGIVAREGDWAVIRIQDTGVGMPPELLSAAFDLFVQGERSLARTEGGLGIGLTIVRQLVALHGGSVTARSAGAGKGSEFIVLLPALSHESLSTRAAPERPAARSVSRRRVLVVDDNRDSADMLEALLTMFGHDVRMVHDGPSALAAAVEFGPDVVLLDIGLPGMSGYDVAMRLRQTPRFGRTTLIAFTGYGQDEDRQRARDAGFDHHLVKPVEPATLERIIAAAPAASLERDGG
jgi:PAS domain S-box-containing protein